MEQTILIEEFFAKRNLYTQDNENTMQEIDLDSFNNNTTDSVKMSSINPQSPFDVETYLNNLPANIEIIDISGKKIKYIPDDALKRFTHLKIFYCYKNGTLNNRLNILPSFLPPTLTEIYCFENNLTQLPDQLPPSLQILACYDNALTQLPAVLPPTLTKLYCNNNALSSLPPSLAQCSDLTELYCSNNQLSSLPDLPSGLKILECFNNDNLPYDVLPLRMFKRTADTTVYILTLQRFRRKYYYWKYKAKMMAWLWRVREPRLLKDLQKENTGLRFRKLI